MTSIFAATYVFAVCFFFLGFWAERDRDAPPAVGRMLAGSLVLPFVALVAGVYVLLERVALAALRVSRWRWFT